MRYPEMKKLLVERGYEFLRQASGSHEIWLNQISGSTVLVSRSGLCDARAKQNWIHRLEKIK